MQRVIHNDQLTLADVPNAGVPWQGISDFALTYYCHTNEGAVSSELYNCPPPLDADLDTLRAWLFAQQRVIRGGYLDDPDDAPVMLSPIRQAIEAIRMRVYMNAGSTTA